MLKFSADLIVNRHVEKVFVWLVNADNQRKFDKSSIEMEVLTPGPWRTGTQFREIRDLGGRKTEVFSEIADLETNKRFIIKSKTGPGWVGTWLFAPEGMGTRLHWTGELNIKGFARLFEPLIGKQMRPQKAGQFSQLPDLIESELKE